MEGTITLQEIKKLAARLRYWSLRMSTQSQSGHPTSSLSAADMMAVLVAHHFKYDAGHPENVHNDRLIFSKGHATPLYYALFEALGVLDAPDLLQYRQMGSVLEGHPTPRFKHTLVATGSLGMGVGFAAGIGMALEKYKSSGRVWVLLGDGEMAEGSIWESLAFVSHHKLKNISIMIDMNRLGQSGQTAYGYDAELYTKRLEAFGWCVIQVDGHSIDKLDKAFMQARSSELPLAIVAQTVKGKGVSFLEDQEGWHGKALSPGELERAVQELGEVSVKSITIDKPQHLMITPAKGAIEPVENLITESELSVREAIGRALEAAAHHSNTIMVIDGDVNNSTFTNLVKEREPHQFIEAYIAEQTMVMVAAGLSSMQFQPVVVTFAAFLTRCFDQIRMAAVSGAPMTLIGTHVGVSIGQDGPSQMGLEDMAMMRAVHGSIILSPSDAMQAAALVPLVLNHKGISYMRATRGSAPVIYKEEDQFNVGGSVVLKHSRKDVVTIVATGVCVHEALKAYDLLKKHGIAARVIDAYSIKPIDQKTLHAAALETGHIITVEDHWYDGGLGEAVLGAFVAYDGVMPHFSRLAVKEMPRSGKPEQLLEKYGISAKAIVEAVRHLSQP